MSWWGASEGAGGGVGAWGGSGDFGAGAEERGADADVGGAFLDGNLEVAGHAHREVGQADAEAGFHVVAKGMEAREVGAGVLGLWVEGSHGHEAGEGEDVGVGEDVFDDAWERLGGEAVFGGLARDVDLEVDFGAGAGLAGGGLDGVGQVGAVHGVDGLEEADGLFGLVALEVADEVPVGGGGGKGNLPGGLLYLVFAEEGHAGVHGIADDVGAVGLGDGDEADIECWMVDDDYNSQVFFARQVFFPDNEDVYKAWKTFLNHEIDPEEWSAAAGMVSHPFPRPASGRIAVKVINRFGDEVVKIFDLTNR